MLRLALALVFLSLPFPAHADITGKARVVDGGTIRIGKTKIRLHGIDAPETKQECYRVDDSTYRCGEAATDALRVLIGVAPGRLKEDDPSPVLADARKIAKGLHEIVGI